MGNSKKNKHRVNRAVRRREKGSDAQKPQSRHEQTAKPSRANEHPLDLAHARGKIDDEQFAAGKRLRGLCETLERSGRDSTQLDGGVRGGGIALPWTDAQRVAAIEVGKLRDRLGGDTAANWIICRAFCGDGWSMADAVRKSGVPYHEDAILPRVLEALDALAGKKRPELPPAAKQASAVASAPKKPYQGICAGCGEKLWLVISVRSRLCELLVCLPCLRIESLEVADGRSPVARYRQTLRDHADATKAMSDGPKRGGSKKVA